MRNQNQKSNCQEHPMNLFRGSLKIPAKLVCSHYSFLSFLGTKTGNRINMGFWLWPVYNQTDDSTTVYRCTIGGRGQMI